jgi:hypothetical protein
MELVPEAVVRWRARDDLAGHWQQYRAYAEGDALAGMHPRRHLLRFAVYSGLAGALATRDRRVMAAAALAGLAYARKPMTRALRRLRGGKRAAAAVGVPLLMAITDAAKMTGYVRGLARRRAGAGRSG